ncbi:MAG: tetratricopeptide repeat protein, partial [Spirochaetota bacterium]
MAFVSTLIFTIFFLSSVFSQNNSEADYYYEKGRIEYESEMYGFAEENLTRTLSIDPSRYRACAMLGDIKLKRKKREEALAWYNRSLELNGNQDDIL